MNSKRTTEPWVKELLDLGIGALAIKHLAMLNMSIKDYNKCVACGHIAGKWSRQCPACRNERY